MESRRARLAAALLSAATGYEAAFLTSQICTSFRLLGVREFCRSTAMTVRIRYRQQAFGPSSGVSRTAVGLYPIPTLVFTRLLRRLSDRQKATALFVQTLVMCTQGPVLGGAFTLFWTLSPSEDRAAAFDTYTKFLGHLATMVSLEFAVPPVAVYLGVSERGQFRTMKSIQARAPWLIVSAIDQSADRVMSGRPLYEAGGLRANSTKRFLATSDPSQTQCGRRMSCGKARYMIS